MSNERDPLQFYTTTELLEMPLPVKQKFIYPLSLLDVKELVWKNYLTTKRLRLLQYLNIVQFFLILFLSMALLSLLK